MTSPPRGDVGGSLTAVDRIDAVVLGNCIDNLVDRPRLRGGRCLGVDTEVVEDLLRDGGR